MRHGVIADLHGNEVALRAVLDDAASCGVDRWWVLGATRPAHATAHGLRAEHRTVAFDVDASGIWGVHGIGEMVFGVC